MKSPLLTEIDRIARVRAALPSAKQLADAHHVTPRYVRRLLRKATDEAKLFLFGKFRFTTSKLAPQSGTATEILGCFDHAEDAREACRRSKGATMEAA